jgi:hypothetical protein
LTKKAPYKGLGADSEEKREPVSDIDTVAEVDSLKVLDPKRPIREADIDRHGRGTARSLMTQLRHRPAFHVAVAKAVFVFLAAPSCSSYITGEILPIIGGYLGVCVPKTLSGDDCGFFAR